MSAHDNQEPSAAEPRDPTPLAFRSGDQIAEDVIENLYAAGLTIHAVLDQVEPVVSQRLNQALDHIDTAVRDVQSEAFLSARTIAEMEPNEGAPETRIARRTSMQS